MQECGNQIAYRPEGHTNIHTVRSSFIDLCHFTDVYPPRSAKAIGGKRPSRMENACTFSAASQLFRTTPARQRAEHLLAARVNTLGSNGFEKRRSKRNLL
jgi:hypothetical protein